MNKLIKTGSFYWKGHCSYENKCTFDNIECFGNLWETTDNFMNTCYVPDDPLKRITHLGLQDQLSSKNKVLATTISN